MAALVDVGFVAPEVVAGVVTELLQLREVGLWGAAVVTGDDQQRILREALFVEGVHDLSNAVVGLHHEIGVRIQLAFTLPFGGRGDGRVR